LTGMRCSPFAPKILPAICMNLILTPRRDMRQCCLTVSQQNALPREGDARLRYRVSRAAVLPLHITSLFGCVCLSVLSL
jgi:hypothetical protein